MLVLVLVVVVVVVALDAVAASYSSSDRRRDDGSDAGSRTGPPSLAPSMRCILAAASDRRGRTYTCTTIAWRRRIDIKIADDDAMLKECISGDKSRNRKL